MVFSDDTLNALLQFTSYHIPLQRTLEFQRVPFSKLNQLQNRPMVGFFLLDDQGIHELIHLSSNKLSPSHQEVGVTFYPPQVAFHRNELTR